MIEGSVPQPSQGAKYYILLDLVRFLSAILVMALHLGFWAWWKNGDSIGTIGLMFPNYPEFNELIPFTWFGWVGVQVFFVISGFVIAMSAEKSTALRFLRSRFLRIYPVTWACATVALIIVLVAAKQQFEFSVFLRFLNTIVISPYPAWIDGVYWTLALELVFYGLVFLMIAAGRSEQLIGLGLALGCLSTAYIAGLSSGLLPGGWIFTLLLLRHGVFFSIGMVVWNLTKADASKSWRNLAFLALFTFMGVIEILHTALTKLEALNLVAPLYPPVILWLTMLCCIFASASWPEAFNRLLLPARRMLRVLGLSTFPLYLLHQTVGGATVALLDGAGSSRGLALFVAALASIAASVIIALLVEPRIRKFAAVGFDALIRFFQSNKFLRFYR